MAVPTTGSFLMFGTGSNTTIAGAIIEGGASSETVASTLNFNALKALANINKFDAEFKEGATTLEEIVKTIQFRGYPIISLCDFNGLTIICDPTTTTTTTTTAAPTTTTTTIAPTTTTTTTTVAPCSLTLYFNTSAIPSPGGWDTQTEACEGTGTMLTVYTTGPTCPTTFNEVFNDGKALYTDSSLTTLLDGNDKWFKDTSSPNSGQAIQVGNDGFINQIGVCNPTTTTTTTTTAAPTTTTTAAPTTTTTAAPTTTTTAAPTTTTTTTAAPTIYTHGAVRAICSDYCTTNYNITTLTLADADYDALTIGDTIYGQGGVAGFVAYSNVSTDTATGPFRIAEIDSSGVVVSIKVCVGGSCEVL